MRAHAKRTFLACARASPTSPQRRPPGYPRATRMSTGIVTSGGVVPELEMGARDLERLLAWDRAADLRLVPPSHAAAAAAALAGRARPNRTGQFVKRTEPIQSPRRSERQLRPWARGRLGRRRVRGQYKSEKNKDYTTLLNQRFGWLCPKGALKRNKTCRIPIMMVVHGRPQVRSTGFWPTPRRSRLGSGRYSVFSGSDFGRGVDSQGPGTPDRIRTSKTATWPKSQPQQRNIAHQSRASSALFGPKSG